MNGPLSGLKVIDLTALAPGPYATMIMGDFGAKVITVERPGHSASRGRLETLREYAGAASRRNGSNPLYRSRQSIVIDLKSGRGRDILMRMVKDADIFIEGFRPGTCARLGIDYPDLAAVNGRLIYCSLSGWGRGHDLQDRAGHDLNYLAESGVLSLSSREKAKPGIPLNLIADFAAGGLMAVVGIAIALHGRNATGRGSHVDASMYSGLLSLLQTAPAWMSAGASDPSWGRGMLNGAAPFYDCYQAADGGWLAIGALEERFFQELCEGLGRPDLRPMYADPDSWPELRSCLESIFATKPRDAWVSVFEEFDAAVSPVRSVTEAFQVAASRGLVSEDFSVGRLPKLSEWQEREDPQVVRHPGQHTRAILEDHGILPAEIEDLIADGIVACSP